MMPIAVTIGLAPAAVVVAAQSVVVVGVSATNAAVAVGAKCSARVATLVGGGTSREVAASGMVGASMSGAPRTLTTRRHTHTFAPAPPHPPSRAARRRACGDEL